MALTLFIIITLCFCVIRLMPGSVYDNPEYSDELIAALEEKAHLNEPLLVQYYYFLRDLIVSGDWGVSLKLYPGKAVFDVLKDKIPTTLVLNVMSLVVSIPLGIIAGTWAALKKSKLPDFIISFLVVLCISVPSFVFASGLQYFIAYKWGAFPIIYDSMGTGFERIRSMVLPVMALSFGSIATICRYLRGELIETLSSEFMLLARTKGLTRFSAITRHAFRNSCVPLANIIIPMFMSIMGGSLVVERIFSIPGVGGLLVNSINANDHWLTIAIMLFYSGISVVTMLLVDVSYGIIDPRIRLSEGKKHG